jgi:NAD(P) transhydrogenase subunit alpha
MDPAIIVSGLTVFVLALFAGAELIARVPQTLHTPLMSGSNAISGIAILGALLAAGHSGTLDATSLIGMLAVVFATINVVGGYLVTQRMLQMFKKKRTKGK